MSNNREPGDFRRRAPVPREACPMALAAELLGERWTLLILREAFYGVSRFDDMREDLGISRAMLTDRLRKMVESGLLEKHRYRETGSRPRDAYVLGPAGRAMALPLMALTQWGEQHVTGRAAPVEVIDRHSGAPLRVALVTPDGQEASLEAASLRLRKNATSD